MSDQVITENTQAPQAAPIESSAPSPAPSVEASPSSPAPSAGGEVVAPQGESAYTPNYKFKALDQEFEIDEEYRGYIKSPDDEKRIKRMFEQFKGVDKLKGMWKEAEAQANEYKTKYDGYEKSLQAINNLANQGEVLKALQYLGFNEDMILNAAKQALDFRDLPEQAKRVHTQAQEQERFAQEMFMRNQAIESQLFEAKKQMKAAELENTLSVPEIKDVQAKFDQAHGPGSFRQEVIREAQAEYLRTQAQTGQGVDITAKDAIERVLRKIKPFLSQPPAQQSVQDAPVIPTTKPGSGSPVVKNFKSLDEINDFRKKQFGY